MKFWEGMTEEEYVCIKKKLIQNGELANDGGFKFHVKDGSISSTVHPQFENKSLKYI